MPEHAVQVILELPGSTSTEAVGVFDEFTLGQKIKRSGLTMLGAVLLSAMLLPIPIIHIIGPPMLLLTGMVLAILQLTYVGRLSAVKVPCPKCGEINRIGGGLGRRSIAPAERMCDACRRGLTLRIVPIAESQVPGGEPQTS
jgi:hypothetical protein